MTTQNLFNVETVSAAIARANARWAQEWGHTEGTKCDSLETAQKYVTADVVTYAAGMLADGSINASDVLGQISDRLPVKATMRMLEMFERMYRGKGSDRTTLLAVCGALMGATSRNAVHFAVTGKGDENTSDHVKNTARVRKLQKLFGLVGVTTVSTQLSRSFGKNGFCNILGMGVFEKGAKGTDPQLKVNAENVFVRALATYADTASENTLKLNQGSKKDSDK
jgi:hypothetical protein